MPVEEIRCACGGAHAITAPPKPSAATSGVPPTSERRIPPLAQDTEPSLSTRWAYTPSISQQAITPPLPSETRRGGVPYKNDAFPRFVPADSQPGATEPEPVRCCT